MSGNETTAAGPGQAASFSSRYGESSSMGSRSDRQARSVTPEGDADGTVRQRTRKSGGFLLDSVFANGIPRGSSGHGKRKALDGQLQVDKRRSAPRPDSSQRKSPLAREVAANVDGTDEQETPRVQSMDTAQLVQMALNLSESRKRHVSNTLQVPLPSPRRVTSGPVGTARASSAARKRSSQYSEDPAQRSPSSNVSSMDDRSSDAIPPVDFAQDNVLHTFSPATLARAERARKYFELASDYRRLLDQLPPLKPDVSGPGNDTTSSPGTAFPHVERVSSLAKDNHALGRQYNPIQALRNRRVRIREKRPFPAPPDTWQDPDAVKKWIDEVEFAAEESGYKSLPNQVAVPRFPGEDGTIATAKLPPATRHKRTDTVGSVITRPENSWTIEPTELLADAYWTEKGDNKAYIETRHGNPIFPPHTRRSTDAPKISVEMHRGRDDQVDAGNESEDFDESGRPSRRRRLMMPLVGGGSERRRHRRLMSRSESASSASSTEGRTYRNSIANRTLGDENIGPLARHMEELIAKDENGQLSSPEVISPDHWDARPHRESLARPEGRASLDIPRVSHRRSKSADGRFGSVDHGMSSLGSESTSSPVAERHVPPVGTDLSSPVDTRRSFDGERNQGPKLPSFRSGSKERHNIGQVDFAAAAETNLATIPSATSWRPTSGQEHQRPAQFTRHKTSDSVTSNLQRSDTNSTFNSIREPGSTVGRLFKGGRERIGGLVRGDGPRFGDRFRNRDKLEGGGMAERTASEASDAEADVFANGYLRHRLNDSAGDESDISPRASFDQKRARPRYHLGNLPSFTSSARDSKGLSTSSDPISRQQDNGKSEKLKKPSPPRIDLPPNDNNGPKPELVHNPTVKFEEMSRKSYGELAPSFPDRRFGISRSPGQRHWSIYDQPQAKQTDKISARDIDRVRTLLLCSGIKARELQRRSDQPRATPSRDLTKAAETTGQTPDPVPLKDEHLYAARLLSTHLTTALTALESTLTHFQTTTARNLSTRLQNLQHKATEHLTKLVHGTADEADAFTVELTTRQPQQTKQVDEAVDTMFRLRRRQFRLLRNAGFKLLEWLVLSIMWGIWLAVVLFNMGRRVVLLVVGFLRWLLVL